MPDLDLNDPLPDRAHDSLRKAVLQAFAGLGENVGDTADAFYLTDVIFELIDTLFVQVDDLTTRLAAVEATGAN